MYAFRLAMCDNLIGHIDDRLVELLHNICGGVKDDKGPTTKCYNLLMVIIVLLS
jgi:hypothetical protein